jgi:protein gp37
MADKTSIEWTQGADGRPGATWNPTTGCDRISPGCDHCYALTMAGRLKAMGSAKYQNDGDPRTSGPGFGLTVHAASFDAPLHWREPRKVFVNSMSDLFHARVPVPFISRVWSVMGRTPQHTYQILTKRPERMLRIVGDDVYGGYWLLKESVTEEDARALYDEWPLLNVHLGTSIETDKYVGRADHLRRTNAALRFLSLEPLIGALPSLVLDDIGWVIIGGESGPGARPMDLGWVRDLIAQCRSTGTGVFVKQMGSVWAREHGSHGKGGDWDRWPADLRIREFPAVAEVVAS